MSLQICQRLVLRSYFTPALNERNMSTSPWKYSFINCHEEELAGHSSFVLRNKGVHLPALTYIFHWNWQEVYYDKVSWLFLAQY